ncbi:MAG: flavodoxin family protein [Anaerolineales bacterium]
MTTVMGIAGSARKRGNSATLMRALLEGAVQAGAETKEVYLNGLTYKGCQGCEPCIGGGGCILEDDLTPILSELAEAKDWVLASPIYYDGVSGQLKTFFDRCRTFTTDPRTHELKPQLAGKRRGMVIVTYEDAPRDDYRRQAQILARYMGWMGDFGEVAVAAEGNLGPSDVARKRPDLLARMAEMGKKTFSMGASHLLG